MDAVKQQVCDARAVVRHGDPGDMVELAIDGTAQVATTARGGQRDVLAVVSDVLYVPVEVSGEHRVVPLSQHFFDLRPIAAHGCVVPQGLMNDHDRPAGLGVFGETPLDEVKLLGLRPRSRHGGFRVAHHSEQFGIEDQEQHVLVYESVVGGTEPPLPGFGHHGVAHIVVADGVKERGFKFVDELFELIPLVV